MDRNMCQFTIPMGFNWMIFQPVMLVFGEVGIIR